MSQSLFEPPVDRPKQTVGDASGTSDHKSKSPTRGRPSRFRWRALGVAAVLVAAAAGLVTLFDGLGGHELPLVLYEVQRGDLEITVVERGALESQDRLEILCEVDDIDGDGIRGTPILSIVPNGSSVTKGDLIVELDVSSHRERLDRQILDTERARAEQIRAKVQYENQKTQNETALAEARLKVELAELALKQFEDETGGTFQIDLQDVELQIQEAQASKLIEETNLEGVEQLYELGYRSRGELAQARLSALKAERQLAAAIARKKELVAYQYRKTKLELEGALASAERALVQVERDNAAELAQAEASMSAADEAFKKEEERLARYREQVKNAKIYAPKDGMVAYATSRGWWSEEVREGAVIRPRQAILTLPDLERMQVRTAIHESVLDQVGPGLSATIRVEALPGVVYKGTVSSVAVLADQDRYMSSGTKVYETLVKIDDTVEQLKPGMSCVVEIHVTRLEDIISVPVQALVERGPETWCYVAVGGDIERRFVETGRTNDKFVEIRDGVDEGDVVVLNPMVVLEDSGARGDDGKLPPDSRLEDEEEDERADESQSDDQNQLRRPRQPRVPAGDDASPTDQRRDKTPKKKSDRGPADAARRPGVTVGTSGPHAGGRTGSGSKGGLP